MIYFNHNLPRVQESQTQFAIFVLKSPPPGMIRVKCL